MLGQFEKVLLEPLSTLKLTDRPTIVLIVDALDECDNDIDAQTIIRLLSRLQSCPGPNVRTFLTSRPELPIRLGFSKIQGQHKDLILHEIPKPEIARDISLFLEHRITQIRESCLLPDDWPGSENIRKLVDLSVPLFIFAATTCRLLDDDQWDPLEVLDDILRYGNDGSKRTDGYHLRATYLPVLNRILRGQSEKQEAQLIAEFQHIVGTIILLESPLSIHALSILLELPVRKIEWRLRSFHSVLNIPQELSKPVRTFHLSFRDFLLDPDTRDATSLWVDEKFTHERLFEQCVTVCRRQLRRNLCELEPGTCRIEIPDHTIHAKISSELQYSCRYWVYHLYHSGATSKIPDTLSFLKCTFIYWMEVMGILGIAFQVTQDLNLLYSISEIRNTTEIGEFLRDARRFAHQTCQTTNKVPLQLYYSGLLFSPNASAIRRCFVQEHPDWMRILSKQDRNWSSDILRIKVAHPPTFLFFPSDSPQIIVSDSSKGPVQNEENTIHIHDVLSGSLRSSIKLPLGFEYLQPRMVSPNGRYLLTSEPSERGVSRRRWNFRLWELSPTDREAVEIWVQSGKEAAFTSDGQALVIADKVAFTFLCIKSGKLKEIQIDFERETFQKVFLAYERSPGHDGTEKGRSTEDLAEDYKKILKDPEVIPEWFRISKNGQFAAAMISGSPIFMIWDTTTGKLKQIIPNRLTGCLLSSTLSPHGDLLAINDGGSMHLWDVASGKLVQTAHELPPVPFISMVEISPDSRYMVFTSNHTAIHIWNLTGDFAKRTVRSGFGTIHSLAFSTDSWILAIGCLGGGIELWDLSLVKNPVATSHGISTLENRPEKEMHTVKLSPNGNLVASSLKARRGLILWDVGDERMRKKFLKLGDYRDHFISSPDSQLLACFSRTPLVNDRPVKSRVSPSLTRYFGIHVATTGQPLSQIEYHCSDIREMAFSPDSRHFMMRCGHGCIRICDAITGVLRFDLQSETSNSSWFCKTTRSVAEKARFERNVSEIRAISTSTTGDELESYETSFDPSSATSKHTSILKFSPDSRSIWILSASNTLEIWDFESRSLIHSSMINRDHVTDFCFTTGGCLLLTRQGPEPLDLQLERLYNLQGSERLDDHYSIALEDCSIGSKPEWITIQGERVFWLPPGRRPRTYDIHDNRVALGNDSSNLTVLEFDVK